MSLGLKHRPHPALRYRCGKPVKVLSFLYIVRFCRMYGTFDIEPFEVRAKSKEEAIRKSLNHRFGDDKPKGDIARGRIEQCPITNKIAWISSDGENIVYLTGPMRIEVADSTAFKSKMSFPD